MSPPRIAASLLGADLLNLGAVVARLEAAGVDALHLDVMDGHFVEDIAFGARWAAALVAGSRLPLEVHLMVSAPRRHIGAFAAAGARRLSFHLEAEHAVTAALADIAARGVEAGVSISPGTGIDSIAWLGDALAQVLVMTCEPGRGGQPMRRATLAKVAALVRMRRRMGHHYRIAVDGGVSFETAGAARRAGADDLVVGQALVGASDFEDALGRLRGATPCL